MQSREIIEESNLLSIFEHVRSRGVTTYRKGRVSKPLLFNRAPAARVQSRWPAFDWRGKKEKSDDQERCTPPEATCTDQIVEIEDSRRSIEDDCRFGISSHSQSDYIHDQKVGRSSLTPDPMERSPYDSAPTMEEARFSSVNEKSDGARDVKTEAEEGSIDPGIIDLDRKPTIESGPVPGSELTAGENMPPDRKSMPQIVGIPSSYHPRGPYVGASSQKSPSGLGATASDVKAEVHERPLDPPPGAPAAKVKVVEGSLPQEAGALNIVTDSSSGKPHSPRKILKVSTVSNRVMELRSGKVALLPVANASLSKKKSAEIIDTALSRGGKPGRPGAINKSTRLPNVKESKSFRCTENSSSVYPSKNDCGTQTGGARGSEIYKSVSQGIYSQKCERLEGIISGLSTLLQKATDLLSAEPRPIKGNVEPQVAVFLEKPRHNGSTPEAATISVNLRVPLDTAIEAHAKHGELQKGGRSLRRGSPATIKCIDLVPNSPRTAARREMMQHSKTLRDHSLPKNHNVHSARDDIFLEQSMCTLSKQDILVDKNYHGATSGFNRNSIPLTPSTSSVSLPGKKPVLRSSRSHVRMPVCATVNLNLQLRCADLI